MKKVEILECTLRDGSYMVQDQFTAQDTANFVRELDRLGFNYIEIGPGIGINAKSKKKVRPASEDYEYVRAAVEVKGNAKIGMFFIPGIGRMEDIKALAAEGLEFIRIGVEAANAEAALEYVEYAKSLNLFTAVNLMKSYTVSSAKFAALAKYFCQNGADAFYLVDSAGGMLPADIEEYICAAKESAPEVRIGFHGHDNLSLAVANTLKAIECGADFIDTTICGLGRSSGNAVTEKMLLILERLGYKHEIDIEELLLFSDGFVKSFMANKVETSVDCVMGYAQFHSGYYDLIMKMAYKYMINPNQLIMEYAKIDKVNVDEQRLEELAKKTRKFSPREFNFGVDIQQGANIDEQLKILKAKFIEYKNKYNALIYFNMSKPYNRNESSISPVIHSLNNTYFGSAEIAEDISVVRKIYDVLAENVDGFLVDNGLEFEENICDRDKLIKYSDALVFASSIYNYLDEFRRKQEDCSVYIDVCNEVKEQLHIESLGIKIVEEREAADILVIGENYLTLEQIADFKKLKWILVTVPGRIDPQISALREDVKLVRIDFKIEIYSEIMKKINYKKLFEEEYGNKIVNGIEYCSGGFIGKKGAIIVNDINKRTQIYGMSNGDGSISYKWGTCNEKN
ncbi:hypothetical protein [Azotosporobacter soli]|uniref:hypothetical protein n=1 Tax=Azotosporobacter soli TaxID=3055040 RepID=UPI0031FF0FF5